MESIKIKQEITQMVNEDQNAFISKMSKWKPTDQSGMTLIQITLEFYHFAIQGLQNNIWSISSNYSFLLKF